jgi:DNA replication protein DnaC
MSAVAIPAAPNCSHCREPIEEGGGRTHQLKIGSPRHYLHTHCWNQWLEVCSRQDRTENRRRGLLAGFSECMRDAPRWNFARFGNPEFRQRASKKVFNALESYEPVNSGNLFLSGRTGIGKTACCCAWQFRNLDQGLTQVGKDNPPHAFFPFLFVSGLELAGARKRAGLGEEAPLVARALRAPLLFLDEVGFEPLNEELQYVLDARYRAEVRTILTTGLSPVQWRDRFGDALLRRIIEHGALVVAETTA